tara:strand:+ start:4454 stop:5752 length:1299 start_codon:yes stop_codon:yes gene_type:complete
MPLCNENTSTCTPDQIFAATAIPACGKFVNPGNLQCEQLVYNQAFSDLINNYGIPISYYINTFNTLSADLLYGQETTQKFFGPIEMQMYIELADDAISLTKFGFDPGDEFTAFVHISSFTTSVSAEFDYFSHNQSIEPKSGDLISLSALGCDRPNGRGEVVYQITERMDQDMSVLNPILGHYVYRLRGKRFNYSFENGLSADSDPPTNAKAVDAINVDGYIAGGGDNQFFITIPEVAGGSATRIGILLDISASGSPTASTNQITIGASGETDAAVAANIIKAINGTAASRIAYGNSSGDGSEGVGVKGITAAEGSSDVQITFTVSTPGTAGDIEGAIEDSEGAINLVAVNDFSCRCGGLRPASEPVNEQIYDSTFSGILSTTLAGQVSSKGKTYPNNTSNENRHQPYSIDNVSKEDVLDMSVNDTDIYGSYY